MDKQEALRKYGRHAGDCLGGLSGSKRPCTCGFEDALAASAEPAQAETGSLADNLRIEMTDNGRWVVCVENWFPDEERARTACRKWKSAYSAAPLVKDMVSRFLGWPLPKTFAPDCGISFDGRKDDGWNKNKSWPIGTNLLNAEEAKAMFEYVLAGQTSAEPAQAQVVAIPEGWCTVELERIFAASIGEPITADMKRAAHIALKIARGERYCAKTDKWLSAAPSLPQPSEQSAAPSAAPVAQGERTNFEAWLRSRWPNAQRPIDEKTDNGHYAFSENNLLWETWQAALSAQPVAKQPTEQISDEEIIEAWEDEVANADELDVADAQIIAFVRALLSHQAQPVADKDAQRLLEQKAFAFDEWIKKTNWVQEQILTFSPKALGKHRADVMREEIERLRAIASQGEKK